MACQKGLADIAKALLEARADTDMTEEVHCIDYIRLRSLYDLWVHVATVSYNIVQYCTILYYRITFVSTEYRPDGPLFCC